MEYTKAEVTPSRHCLNISRAKIINPLIDHCTVLTQFQTPSPTAIPASLMIHLKNGQFFLTRIEEPPGSEGKILESSRQQHAHIQSDTKDSDVVDGLVDSRRFGTLIEVISNVKTAWHEAGLNNDRANNISKSRDTISTPSLTVPLFPIA